MNLWLGILKHPDSYDSYVKLPVFHLWPDETVIDDINIKVVVNLFIDFPWFLGEDVPQYLTICTSIGFPYVSIEQIQVETNADFFFSLVILDLISILVHDFLSMVHNMDKKLLIKLFVLL